MLRTLVEGISRRDVVESQAGKLAEEGEIGTEVGLKTVETPKARIDKREGDHRGRGLGNKKHRKFIDKISVGEPLSDGSRIALGREVFLVDSELLSEIANLLLFGFKECVIEPCQDEIESSEPGTDVLDRMLATEADVVLADGFIKISAQTAFSRLTADEANKLLAREVAGMRGHQVEKTGFVLGVAE